MTAQYRPPAAEKSPFGELLTRLRTQRGLTQEGLAKATGSDRISSRSITNYERSVTNARNWILPHRPALKSLGDALTLDTAEQHALVEAWHETRAMKDAGAQRESTLSYIPDGRESVVSRIMDAWDTAKQGTPQFVMLGGDSGIGKTTIARHICDTIAASSKEVMISWGEAHSWATPLEPYLSLRHATDRMLVPPAAAFMLPGVYPNRPQISEEITRQVMKSIPQLGGVLISESTIRDLAENQGGMSSAGIDSMLNMRASTQSVGRWDEYATLITSMSQSWPIVLVLEDMHWSSEHSGALLQHLAHHLGIRTDVPLMIICTYRSNELLPRTEDTQHPFAKFLDRTANLASVTQIYMHETLSPNHGSSFIHAVVRTLSLFSAKNETELSTWLYQRTSGHPMLTLEMIRHLRENSGLTRVGRTSSWRFDQAKVPDGLSTATSTLIAQRVALIDRRGRIALEIAAAMGETILPQVIADVLKIEEQPLLDLIDTVLVDRHEMLMQGPLVSVGHGTHPTYRFPHALLQEYIYSEIRPTRRRRVHLDIAESLARRFANTDITAMGEITHHYALAQDWHSAQMAAYRMAQLKASRLDWELASIWFDQAEQFATQAKDPHQLWRARSARLAVLRGLSQFEEAIALGKRILHQAELHNWQSILALTHHHLGEVYYDLGQLDRSVESINIAANIHEAEHAFDLAAAAQAMLSHATYRQGKYDIAREHARRSMAYTRETHNSWVRSEALLAMANCDVDIGYYREAIENYQAAIELASMTGKLSNQFLPALNIGLCNVMLANYDAAIEQLTTTLEHMRPHHVPRVMAWGQLYLGFALEGAGRLDEATESFAASEEARRQHDQLPVMYDTLGGLLSVSIRRDDETSVRKYLTEIVDYLNAQGPEGLEDSNLVMLTVARGYRMLGDDEQYWHWLEQVHTRLMQRASLIKDPASTTSYLTQVPTNAEIVQRFSERGNE